MSFSSLDALLKLSKSTYPDPVEGKGIEKCSTAGLCLGTLYHAKKALKPHPWPDGVLFKYFL